MITTNRTCPNSHIYGEFRFFMGNLQLNMIRHFDYFIFGPFPNSLSLQYLHRLQFRQDISRIFAIPFLRANEQFFIAKNCRKLRITRKLYCARNTHFCAFCVTLYIYLFAVPLQFLFKAVRHSNCY